MSKRRKPKMPRMGGGLPMGGGLMDMAQKIQELQAEMARIQDELAETTLEVTAGGGAVTVVITGQQEIRSITIAPEVIDPEDVEMLQDLIVAAVNQALEQSRAMAAEKIQAVTGGLDLGGLGGLAGL